MWHLLPNLPEVPKNIVAKDSLKRLHIYADANYEQQAQKPIVLE